MITAVIISAVAYGLSMWFSGVYFGKKDHEHLPIYDVGFRFHLATFLTHNTVSILWFTFNFQSANENSKTVYITMFIWSAFLLTHMIFFLSSRKSAIKNLDKSDLFE